jgi:hypothetical protein
LESGQVCFEAAIARPVNASTCHQSLAEQSLFAIALSHKGLTENFPPLGLRQTRAAEFDAHS